MPPLQCKTIIRIYSVPVLGIIFYLDQNLVPIYIIWHINFRPHFGDYFFITPIISVVRQNVYDSFPSPYWGLFFYRVRKV